MKPQPFFVILIGVMIGSLKAIGQTLTIRNATKKPITVQVEVMGRYKSHQPFDSLTIAPKGTATLNRKNSPLTFYSVTVNKVAETYKDFVWERDVELAFDESSKFTVKGSTLTTEWDDFDKNMVLPVRDKLVANTIEYNKLLAAGDTLGGEKYLQKSNQAIEELNKQLDSIIFASRRNFLDLYLLAGRWRAWPKSVCNEQLQAYAAAWGNHPFHKAIVDEIKKIESFGEGVRIQPFKKTSIDNQEVNLAKIKPDYILLDFWGSWCGPCIKAIPELQNLYSTFDASRLQIIGIAAENEVPSSPLRALLKKKDIGWTQIEELRLGDKTLAKQLNITFYPTYFLLDKNLKIIKRGDSRILKEVREILLGN